MSRACEPNMIKPGNAHYLIASHTLLPKQINSRKIKKAMPIMVSGQFVFLSSLFSLFTSSFVTLVPQES